MSRCSSWHTKHTCISNFFSAYPTPSAFLQLVVKDGEVSACREVVYSLGLFDDRLKSLTSITQAFLLGGDVFSVDLKEHKIHGVGKFGWQSWLLFCRDMGATIKPDDAALASFASWRKKQDPNSKMDKIDRSAGPSAADVD